MLATLIKGGIAATVGFGALALTPAFADEIYVQETAPGYYAGTVTVLPSAPRYEPPPYVVEAPRRVIVAEPVAPRPRVIVREPAPRAVYAPLPADEIDSGCRTFQREDAYGRMITVSSGC
ncbi:hypothetical protein [Bosea sp. 117]|uniref:hypothetical protein n=1 Tax=Bosea sp. 117 TaxID=1125973 RepID=UPI000493D524|nr:hypothetical protein [Bosea sp. 117]